MNKRLIESPSFKQIINDNFIPLVEDIYDVKGIIYRATNVINGKVYIGQTTKSLEERIHKHANSLGTKFIFQRAIEKYGIDNFEIEIVDVFYSKEECIEKEKLYIWLNDSWANRELGYNLTPGGEWGDTISHHPDREKIIEKSRNSLIKSGKSKGKNNPRYGKSDHCKGLVTFAKNRKGKSNIELYGEEKAIEMERSRIETNNKKKELGIKRKYEEKIPMSDEFILFVLSYGIYDKNIDSFKKLYPIFLIGNKTANAIHCKAKKRFPEKVKQLNSIFKSRQSSGEKNPRYGATISKEIRTKISNSNKGRIAHNRKIKSSDELNRLVDLYFEKYDTKWIAEQMKTDAGTIRNYLKILNLPRFNYRSKKDKLQFFNTHTKEEYYVK